jgi:dUTP pyrophosphatase
MSENKKELKFKVGDIVQIKQTVNIYQELANCGINNRIIDPPIPTMPDNLYNALLLDTAVILETNTTDFLPYLVLFREINKKFYISEELLKSVTTSNEVSNNETIKIKYHEPITPLENINGANSDWIDLRCAEPNGIDLKTGEFKLISLGVSMKLPDGYEAHIAPRSSTFKNWGILEVNSVGVVDSSFCSNEDIWKFPAYATRDTHIDFNDRICQFRIVKKQPVIIFEKVDHLDGKSRGGFGSSGIK